MAAEAATDVSEAVDTQARDAWLAEHLLGGPRANPGWYWFRGTNETDGFPDIDVPGQEPLFSGPKLGTTGNGMLMVIDAMWKRGYDVSIGQSPPPSLWGGAPATSPTYHALFTPRGEGGTHTRGDTLPAAVAQAALAALEAEGA